MTSFDVTWSHLTSRDVIWRHMMSYDIVLRHVTSWHPELMACVCWSIIAKGLWGEGTLQHGSREVHQCSGVFFFHICPTIEYFCTDLVGKLLPQSLSGPVITLTRNWSNQWKWPYLILDSTHVLVFSRQQPVYSMVNKSWQGSFFRVGGKRNKNKICMVNVIGEKWSYWADLYTLKARLIKKNPSFSDM